MDVNKLLDELEELIEQRPLPVVSKLRPMRKVFFLDVDEVLDLTHQIRASLPQQIQKADQITRERDRILAEAREQADRMVTEAAEQAELKIRHAQEEASMLVANHEITRQAQMEGQRIIEQAGRDGETIRQGALEFARNAFTNVEQSLDAVMQRMSHVQQVAQQAREEIQSPRNG